MPIKLLVDGLRLGVQYNKTKGWRREDFCQFLDLKGGRIGGGYHAVGAPGATSVVDGDADLGTAPPRSRKLDP